MTSEHLQKLYLDTCTINELYKLWSPEDASATKVYQSINKSRGFYISPINIYEVLLYKNEMERERIIYFCQNLFQSTMLPSAEELIVKYINCGCPKIQEPYTLKSTLKLANTWENIYIDKQQTFIYDISTLNQRMSVFRDIVKSIKMLINNPINFNNHKDRNIYSVFLDTYFGYVNRLFREELIEKIDFEGREELQIVIFYVFLMLCSEITLCPEPFHAFWKSIKLNHLNEWDRLLFLLKHSPLLFTQGPFYLMGLTTYLQIISNTYSRGTFFDSLHFIYLTYVDLFISSDRSLNILRVNDIYPHKLFLFSELKLFYPER